MRRDKRLFEKLSSIKQFSNLQVKFTFKCKPYDNKGKKFHYFKILKQLI